MYFKETGFQIQWDGIRYPFHKNVWMAIIFCLISAAFLLKVAHFIGIKLGLEEFTQCQNFFAVITAFLQQGNLDKQKTMSYYKIYETMPIIILGCSFEPKSITCRIIVLATLMFSLLIYIFYSAILTSFITVQKPIMPFRTWWEFLEGKTYTLEQIPGSSAYVSFSVRIVNTNAHESYIL